MHVPSDGSAGAAQMTDERVDDLAPRPRFALAPGEPAGEGIRRVVVSQVSLAQWHAQRIATGGEHVHGVRRTTKRVRAVLRLVRDHIGEMPYRQNNVLLRDVARELSETRSADMRIETLDALVVGRPDLESATAELREGLVATAKRMRTTMRADVELGRGLAERLGIVSANARLWSMDGEMMPTEAGLGRTYLRGRRAMARVYAEPSVDRFHEWRKRVKYVRHQAEVLSVSEHGAMSQTASAFEAIGEELGVDHDLADLGYAVTHGSGSATPESGQVLAAIEIRRREIQTELAPKARRLYAPSKRDFVTRMTADFFRSSVDSGNMLPESTLERERGGGF